MNPSPVKTTEYILDKFLSIESELNLISKREADIPFWELIRYPLYLEILRNCELRAPVKKTQHKTFKTLWGYFKSILISMTWRNPLRAHKKGLLFIGHPRRKHENGIYVDIYTDPFIDLISDEYHCVVLEKSLAGIHRQPVSTKELFYLDGFSLVSAVIRKLLCKNISVENRQLCEKIGKRIQDDIGITVDIENYVTRAVVRWKSEFKLFKWLFNYLKPQAIFLVVSAGNESLVAAARSNGIPTAELQHGSPAKGKLNYDYPKNSIKTTFPDYFLSFGSNWTHHVNLPLKSEHIFPIGFPYMQQKQYIYSDIKKENQILVLSQPDIGHFLAKFVLSLVNHLNGSVSIIYKLHPAEVKDKSKYSDLEEAGVTLISDNKTELYELLAKSRWQLGVYSTALLEGIAFSCKTYILNAPGSEFMAPYVLEGFAQYIELPEEMNLDINEIDELNLARLFYMPQKEEIMNVVQNISIKGYSSLDVGLVGSLK